MFKPSVRPPNQIRARNHDRQPGGEPRNSRL